MIFHPQSIKLTEQSYTLDKCVTATAHSCLCYPIHSEFWKNFSFQSSTLITTPCKDLTFTVGSAPALPLGTSAYTVNVTPDGICISAKDEQSLCHGFMTLIDRFYAVDTEDGIGVCVDCCEISDRALISNRMVHFCIFPETELWEMERFIRFCGALKYTHIIFEFWGMLKYDCLKELAWSHGYTKEQIRPLIALAKQLGMEVIPMFNHWGHASAGRVMHGKHVVLDQNPALQTYFSDDGWCWDIRRPKVRALLRSIREELLELCGDSRYFHIGCDEAYNFSFTEENMNFICDYLNEISAEMIAKGRRAIIWGDMLLYTYEHYNPKNRYCNHAPTPEAANYMLARLSRDLIIADWQYHAKFAPVETADVFVKAGFDCILCPWDDGVQSMQAVMSTAKDSSLLGIMHTTWHTLSAGYPYVLAAALGCFEDISSGISSTKIAALSAELMRKAMPSKGVYEKAGWCPRQIYYKW